MTTPTLSIICFVYNHGDYLREALEGFVMQKTNFPFEVIVHDDASTDRSPIIIKEFENKYSEIIKPIYQTINQHSIEKGRVTKICYEAAKGEYIAFCEGDDYWIDPFKLQKQVDVLRNNKEFTLSVGKVKGLYDDTKQFFRIHEFANPSKRAVYTLGDYLLYRFSQTSSFVFRRDAYDYTVTKGFFAGDQSLVINVLTKGNAYYHPDFFSVYRVNDKSVTFNINSEQKVHNMLKFWDQVNEFTNYRYSSTIKWHKIRTKLELSKDVLPVKMLIKALYILRIRFIYYIKNSLNA